MALRCDTKGPCSLHYCITSSALIIIALSYFYHTKSCTHVQHFNNNILAINTPTDNDCIVSNQIPNNKVYLWQLKVFRDTFYLHRRKQINGCLWEITHVCGSWLPCAIYKQNHSSSKMDRPGSFYCTPATDDVLPRRIETTRRSSDNASASLRSSSEHLDDSTTAPVFVK